MTDWLSRPLAALLVVFVIGTTARATAGPEPATEVPLHATVVPPNPITETAEKPEPEPRERPVTRETTAADVAGAPAPGDESGRIDPGDGGDSLLRRCLRMVLFVPKLAFGVALTPLGASVWASEHFKLMERYNRVFFNEAGTIGLVPTATFESGFGPNVGVRFVDRDLIGAREHLSLEASTGGHYYQSYTAALRSGDRFGDHVGIELDGQYARSPQDPFYGIGNHDDSMVPAAVVDPRVDPTAVETRYRERIARIAGVIDVRPFGGFHVLSSTELTDRVFSASQDGRSIDTVYDPAALVGYGGVRYLYSELELRLDDRRRASELEPRSLYATGSLAAVFGGRIHRLDGGRDYWRYGGDLQHFIRITEGPRVLALRLHGEAVSGTLSEVPFTELPSLGGWRYLRGYALDRFRDRVAAFGSIDYEWDLMQFVSASLFVDAGRVFPGIGELSFDHLRVGYGVALEFHTIRSFGLQASLASSIDGGLLLTLSFNRVFDLDPRVSRL